MSEIATSQKTGDDYTVSKWMSNAHLHVCKFCQQIMFV